MKKWITGFLAVLMLLMLSLCAVFAETAHTYTIRTEEMEIEDAGVTASEWETAVSEMRSDGLEHQLTADDLRAADPDVEIYTADGTIYCIEGRQLAEGVESALDAYHFAYQLVTLLGGADETALNLWSVIQADNRTIYSFQQVQEGLTVMASTIRLVTDADHHVTAVFSSLSGGDAVSGGKEITAEEAEAAVTAHLRENNIEEPVLSEYTHKVIIPIESSIMDDEQVQDRIVWAVYTRNPQFGSTRVVDLPYLAHYVQMDGEYLYNNTVTKPRDMAGLSGYSSIYTFEFMEAEKWTGEVTYSDGQTRELTVPVMRDTRTNVYYLGDLERRIMVGDFASLAYGDEIVRMHVSPENEWDDVDLITYANFIKAWDFFARMGWTGPDGQGTPTLLLRKLCLENGEPIENACYIGKLQGWQCFGYSEVGDLGQCLDVIGHEFMHCVSSTLMNTNLYQDDWGAINEAMSDIMGNICELSWGDTRDTAWEVGENLGSAIRSMSDPHRFDQPEYVWDVFYVPHTDTPNDVNDRGGVHFNSSLLNLVAARLCMDCGMTLDEARDFFMMVACGLTPKTDYPQIVTQLRWALTASGNEKYRDDLEKIIADVKFEVTEIPEELPEGQFLAVLDIPQTEVMDDPSWAVLAVQINTKEIKSRISALISMAQLLLSKDESRNPQEELEDLLSRLHMDGLSMTFRDPDKSDDDRIDAAIDDLTNVLKGLFTQNFSWKQAGTSSAPMVLNDWMTIYTMMNIDTKTMQPCGLAVLIGGQWYDVLAFADEDSTGLDQLLNSGFAQELPGKLFGLFFGEDEPAETSQVRVIPNNGLENVKLHTLFTGEETADGAAEEAAEETADDAAEKTAEETADGTAEEAAEETTEEAGTEAAGTDMADQESGEDAADDADEELPKAA